MNSSGNRGQTTFIEIGPNFADGPLMADKRPSSLTMKEPDCGVNQRSVYDPQQPFEQLNNIQIKYG